MKRTYKEISIIISSIAKTSPKTNRSLEKAKHHKRIKVSRPKPKRKGIRKISRSKIRARYKVKTLGPKRAKSKRTTAKKTTKPHFISLKTEISRLTKKAMKLDDELATFLEEASKMAEASKSMYVNTPKPYLEKTPFAYFRELAIAHESGKLTKYHYEAKVDVLDETVITISPTNTDAFRKSIENLLLFSVKAVNAIRKMVGATSILGSMPALDYYGQVVIDITPKFLSVSIKLKSKAHNVESEAVKIKKVFVLMSNNRDRVNRLFMKYLKVEAKKDHILIRWYGPVDEIKKVFLKK